MNKLLYTIENELPPGSVYEQQKKENGDARWKSWLGCVNLLWQSISHGGLLLDLALMQQDTIYFFSNLFHPTERLTSR